MVSRLVRPVARWDADPPLATWHSRWWGEPVDRRRCVHSRSPVSDPGDRSLGPCSRGRQTDHHTPNAYSQLVSRQGPLMARPGASSHGDRTCSVRRVDLWAWGVFAVVRHRGIGRVDQWRRWTIWKMMLVLESSIDY